MERRRIILIREKRPPTTKSTWKSHLGDPSGLHEGDDKNVAHHKEHQESEYDERVEGPHAVIVVAPHIVRTLGRNTSEENKGKKKVRGWDDGHDWKIDR